MARCPNCNDEVPDGAWFCPHCGIGQPRRPARQEQPSLPLSPWGPPPRAVQPAGAAALSQPISTGTPLPISTVVITVAAVIVSLLLVIMIGRGGLHFGGMNAPRQASGASLPVLGIKGEAITLGSTTWGAAFTDTLASLDHQQPQRGQFFAVGIVIGNRGGNDCELSRASVGLIDDGSGTRYTPTMTAWGTPDQITGGEYAERFLLRPQQTIAGLIIFDVPRELPQPRLLVRDLLSSSTEFTGQIDLTREKSEQRIDERHPGWRARFARQGEGSGER